MKRLSNFLLSILLTGTVAPAQEVLIRNAQPLDMPQVADSNSPAFWREGHLYLFNSAAWPFRVGGPDLFSLVDLGAVRVSPPGRDPLWIESVWQAGDGTLYAWYHYERHEICPGSRLAEPAIGALVSYDGGETFRDLGLVLSSSEPVDCSAMNGYFAGGHGDFSVILDQAQEFFYFHFGNYGGSASSQGVAVARMAFADRDQPVGAVWKYHEGTWTEPGLGGRVTPIFPVNVPWQDSAADAFWGPAIHWNTHLETYVALLNRACCWPDWPQEGIYISVNADLSSPEGWSMPVAIFDSWGEKVGFGIPYYPQVIGLGPGETDTLVGRRARLFLSGHSEWEVEFRRATDPLPEPEPEPEPDFQGPGSTPTRPPLRGRRR